MKFSKAKYFIKLQKYRAVLNQKVFDLQTNFVVNSYEITRIDMLKRQSCSILGSAPEILKRG